MKVNDVDGPSIPQACQNRKQKRFARCTGVGSALVWRGMVLTNTDPCPRCPLPTPVYRDQKSGVRELWEVGA
jgi:hypothetical protein